VAGAAGDAEPAAVAAHALEAIVRASQQIEQGRAFLESVYESEGKPYGATYEGLVRWLGDKDEKSKYMASESPTVGESGETRATG
jgi:hypothetical protein